MCGIAGIINREQPAELLEQRARQMAGRLQHRGPDDSGSWAEAGVALAHVRLALIDIANGQQPFHSPDGRYVMTYNGEIYNFRELRKELSGPFHTDCDTEVVLAAYREWGPECLHRFNGMFAFLIWDRYEETAFAARDLLGIKPFLYRRENNEFSFASEAKALVSASPKIDREPVLEYLVAPCFSGVETSPFTGIEILQPGHMITITPSQFRVEQWGDLFLPREFPPTPPDLREAIRTAVSLSLTADVPIGTYLSGGFDSTLITALARPQRSFSIQFESQESFNNEHSRIVLSDDLPYARQAASKLEIPLSIVPVSDTSLEERVKKVAQQNDLLPAWEQEIAQDALANEASHYFKAILVGDAADETHYGYHFLLDTRSPAEIIRRLSNAPIRKDLLPSPVEHFDEKYRRNFPDIHRLIVKRWLPRLLHNGDVHSMAHGVESRVPFADTSLLRLAEAVSPEAGFHKAHLRNCVSGLMPEEIRLREKSALPKSPFGWKVYRKILIDQYLDVAEEWLEMDLLKTILDKEELIEADQGLVYRLCALGFWTQCYGATTT